MNTPDNDFKKEDLPEIAKKHDIPLPKLQEMFNAIQAESFKEETWKEIALENNVTPSCISSILTKKSYKNAPRP